MQKRVGLARAIAADPEIIFFDEHDHRRLDPIMPADIINNLIVDTVKDMGATTLSITHDMVSAKKIADRIAMLYKGKIVWQRTNCARLRTAAMPLRRSVHSWPGRGLIQKSALQSLAARNRRGFSNRSRTRGRLPKGDATDFVRIL